MSIASSSLGACAAGARARAATPIDRRRRPVLDPPRVAVVRERVQMAAGRPAEERDERRLGELRDLADGADPARVELARRHRPDAPQPLDRQRVQELELAVGRHDEQAVRLGHAARHLGQELGPRHADRDGQPDLARAPAGAAAPRSRSGVPAIRRSPRTSRNASSIESPSTSGVVSSEHREHRLARLGVRRPCAATRRSRRGQSRRAWRPPIAVRTPRAFAS